MLDSILGKIALYGNMLTPVFPPQTLDFAAKFLLQPGSQHVKVLIHLTVSHNWYYNYIPREIIDESEKLH